jgi:hypothetical protein
MEPEEIMVLGSSVCLSECKDTCQKWLSSALRSCRTTPALFMYFKKLVCLYVCDRKSLAVHH